MKGSSRQMRTVSRKGTVALSLSLLLLAGAGLSGCAGAGFSGDAPGNGTNTGGEAVYGEEMIPEDGNGSEGDQEEYAAPEIPGLTLKKTEENRFAEHFRIHEYEDEYRVISSLGNPDLLLLPEGAKKPGKLPEGMLCIQTPLDQIYLAATASMSLFDAAGALDAISWSSLEAEKWYVEHARTAMEEGRIAYAGKYSEPDYERLLSGGCHLALESTMILHTPEVKEKLEAIGIPVFLDRSSMESHPLGRTEWVKIYGALTGNTEEAEAFFSEQERIFSEVTEGLKEELGGERVTIAYFYVNSAGTIVVRKSEDYIPKMIELSGADYMFTDLRGLNENSRSGAVTMSVEEFYRNAKEADILIYDATIDEPLTSKAALLEKNKIFGEFAAFKSGNLYTTDRSFYQATDCTAVIIEELHEMLLQKEGRASESEGKGGDLENRFFRKVE